MSSCSARLGHCTTIWEQQPYDLGYLVSLRFVHNFYFIIAFCDVVCCVAYACTQLLLLQKF